MFRNRQMDDDDFENDEWEYDGPASSSSFSSSFSQDFSQTASVDSPMYGTDPADLSATPMLDDSIYNDDPPILNRPAILANRFDFSIAIPSRWAFWLVVFCASIVFFGIIGAFYTPFSHPALDSFGQWQADKYTTQAGKIEAEIVGMPQTFQQLSQFNNEPLQLSNAVQDSDQQLSQIYLSLQRLKAPSGYGLIQGQLENTLVSEIQALNAYQQYIYTGQSSDENVWRQKVSVMNKEIGYLQTEWKKVE